MGSRLTRQDREYRSMDMDTRRGGGAQIEGEEIGVVGLKIAEDLGDRRQSSQLNKALARATQ
jgi:hypothetical protein